MPPPLRLLAKAISLPSGDHAGSTSIVANESGSRSVEEPHAHAARARTIRSAVATAQYARSRGFGTSLRTAPPNIARIMVRRSVVQPRARRAGWFLVWALL